MRKLAFAAMLAAVTTLSACKKTGENEVQVQTPDVDVSTDTTTVRTPDVDVVADSAKVAVPDVDVNVKKDTATVKVPKVKVNNP